MKLCSYDKLYSRINCPKYNKEIVQDFIFDQREFSILDIVKLDVPDGEIIWLLCDFLTRDEIKQISIDINEEIIIQLDDDNPQLDLKDYFDKIRNKVPENITHDILHGIIQKMKIIPEKDKNTINQLLYNSLNLALQNEYICDYIHLLIIAGELECINPEEIKDE
jgi:hypothetical protein